MIQPIWAWRKCAPWACPPKLRLRQRHRMKFHPPPVGQGTPAYDPVYLLGSPCGLARLGVWHVDVRLLHGALDQPRARGKWDTVCGPPRWPGGLLACAGTHAIGELPHVPCVLGAQGSPHDQATPSQLVVRAYPQGPTQGDARTGRRVLSVRFFKPLESPPLPSAKARLACL